MKRMEREGMKVTMRLVVPRLHIGCLLGKGGKIVEQMQMETRMYILVESRLHVAVHVHGQGDRSGSAVHR